MTDYRPPAPTPPKVKPPLLKRWWQARRDMLKPIPERSYNMKMGHIRMPHGDLYTVCETSLVRRVLVEQWERFPKNRFLHQVLRPLLGDGIIISSGELWKKQRRMVDQAFEQARLQTVFPLMVDAVEAMEARLDRLATGAPVAFDVEMTHVAADIIFRTIYSVPLEQADASRVFRAFMHYQEAAASVWLLGIAGLPTFLAPNRLRAWYWGREIRGLLMPLARARFEQAARGEDGGQRDILASLIRVRDPDTGGAFTRDELVDQLATLFLAGHETTAAALAWAGFLAAKCPEVQERLAAEALAFFGDRRPVFADIKQLKFTRDMFRETLRLYPSLGFLARETAFTEHMRDKVVEAGSSLAVAPWLIHRHRTYWERPDVFDPDRFQTEAGKESLRCAYLPFSLGPRVCLGAGFAMQEAVLILACLFRRYRLVPVEGFEPRPVGRLTIRSENGIRLAIERR